jgi:hypothetical protein
MANKQFLNPINLVNLASDPSSANEGDIYFNTADDIVKVYANGSWVPVGAANQDFIAFDTTPETIPTATGSLYWDSGDGVPAAVLNANVTIGLGQEQVALVKNSTGASIAKGKVVYINGAQGQRPTITLSDADTEASSSKTFGLTAEAIADGSEGFVTTFGVLRGVNTDGLTEGAALWLSSTAGGYTTTIPAEPAHSVFLGYVVKANASSGEIFVNIQNGYELNELHGVTIENDGNLTDNEVLAYDLSSGLWKNQTASEAGLATSSHNHTVDSLSNVVITGTPTDGQSLVWDTTTSKWVNETVSSGGATDLTGLTDVEIDGTPADNEVLAYDSGAGGWKNQTATEAGLLTSSDLANYAPLNSPELTGSPLATTATSGDNSTRIATTEFVATSFALKSGPTFTGTVSLPSTTSIGDVSDTEISYLNNLSSNIQDQLDDKPTLVAGVLSESVIPVEIARVDDISNSTTGYVPVGDKGIAGGVATLNSSGYVPSGQLDPTSVAFLSSPTFTGTVVLPSGTSIGTVTSTEIGYLDGVTSSLQTQLDNKLSSSVAASDYLSKASAISDYQPLDGDLTAIAALAGTSGFLKKSGTNTWVLDTNTYLTTSSATSTYLEITAAATTYAPKPTFTGTVVLPSTTSIGDVSATEIGYLDGVTSAIQTQISSKASTGHTHSYQDADSDLTAIAGITSGVGLLKRLGPDTWTIDTSAYITGSSPTISTSLIAGTSTFNLINSIATTVNFAGGATTLIMGATDAGATTTIRTPTINTASTSLDLFNTTATTVNFAGASTTFNLGGTPTGSLTATLFGNATTTTKTINIGTGGASGSETNINIGSSTSGATGTVSVYPSTNFVGTVTVPTPTSSGHATTKGYVDALAAGITVKAQVVYVSSTNLNATYANGTSDSSGGLGVGATLTGNVDGALILDGPEVEANQRVLIKDQTDAKHNGIYVVTFAGDGDDPFILTRATDFNGNTSTNGIIKNGAYIFVTSGTTSANDSYVVSLGGTSTTPSGAIKIGTDNIVLAQYSGVPNNISTLGYVTTGTWAATPIDKDYIDVEIARTNDPVFTGHVTVPDPTDDTDATSKQYVDDLIFASLPYLPDIIPLDDLRYEFNDRDSRFIPKFQGEQVAINNPLRLLLTINGIIQTVDFPEYVWQSMLPREGFMVDSDGYIAFSEVPPAGSTFDARLMLGPNVNSIKKGYPFKAVDILLGA